MSNHTLETMAGELYVRECRGRDRRRRRREMHKGRGKPANNTASETETQTSPIPSILPGLVGLVAERRHQSVANLRPTIRRAISEHMFAGAADSGVQVQPTDCDRMVDNQVELVVEVLEQVRRRAIREGQWSDAPVTPLMFG